MDLSGYALTPVRQDDVTICRGSGEGVAPILLVTVRDGLPASLKRLEHEYALKAELDGAWSARPIELSGHNDRMTLVLEDPGGEPLDRLIGRPLAVPEVLRIAIALARAIRQLHDRGLVHKDIKPGNVLVDERSGRVWLTGFGIASRVPRERPSLQAPEVIAGTLAYMAPEQTGRMNRSVDARSDLYSLGVTLYELLTGGLPFTASDPLEWVHAHIARRPLPPHERLIAVPAPLSAIVMKLLAKTAEERYQTAAGVEADLRRCLIEWESRGRVDPFPLGAHDASDRLLIPERLYGREHEIDNLLAAFDRVVATGAPELMLVSGYSGIGKSAVVNELHRALVPPHGLFASGKFDQYKRNVPYATLAQAIQSLLRSLLAQNDAALSCWRDAFREALRDNGQLIVNLVPELELVIGKQRPVPDLAPQDAQHRFQMTFRRFLGVFAREEHPLALFLDDLQWLDTATLDLLESVITDSEMHHLLLIGAYRDNEVGPGHPLLRALEAIRVAGTRVHEVVLGPLGLADTGRLIADALRCEPERARPLAELVQEKTGGNPFFAIQFFMALADEGLLAFDSVALAWQWDIDRIRARNYTDNVVELMAAKLKRLSPTTQEALKQLACLGNVVEIATLTLVLGETEETIDAALREAVHAGLVFRHENTYKFLHDRIHQAAYSLILDAQRADMHLRIGHVLLASMTADELDEHLFDVANQLNRGAGGLIGRDEKTQAATIDLRAGCKAKTSAAYGAAREYFSAGMALLDEQDWGSRHELTFCLWRECAECAFLTGNFKEAEQLTGALLQRAASNIAYADAARVRVQLHVVKGEHPLAVDSALTCLRLFGIDIPRHPSWDDVQAEYETVWQTLDERTIESLIDLPLMTDPELQAAMQVLSTLLAPAYYADFHLFCLLVCRMINIGMQHGTSGAFAHGCGWLGTILGPAFHRYGEGYRYAKLACDLVEKHAFIAYQAKAYHSMGLVAFWTQPITTAIDLMRAAFRTATETGDLTVACYGMHQSVTGLLLRNDPLDATWRESERGLDVVRKAKFRDIADIIVSQQRFIATMQGRTETFSTFSDAQFDEAAFEAQLTGDRMTLMICWYWILKLKARFLSGNYAEAFAAAEKAKPLLWASTGRIQSLDYVYYAALTLSVLYENASADEQQAWHELLMAHREQLREWADTFPPTFADKHALVAAEIARLEGQGTDAMRLYEQAIRSAHDHGFVQNEGLAYEVAARFYSARGFETIADAYLRNAKDCYLRWGGNGKASQLDRLHPRLAAPEAHRPAATIGSAVQQLDLASVVKASQAVSSEIVLPKLIERLLTIALENAGADRGVLILPADDDYGIQAEAEATGDKVEVALCQKPITGTTCPESLVRYVIRTHESVILDDASRPNLFSVDDHLRARRSKSILCLPLIKQGRLTGLLYLENTLTSHAFTSDRIAVLELLAAQAAISLENTRLYGDLQEREAKVRRLVDSNIIGIFFWDSEDRIIEANDAFLNMAGRSRDDLTADRIRWSTLTPSEWSGADERAAAELRATGSCRPFEKEYVRKDGSRVPVLVGAATLGGLRDQGVAFVLDLSERKRAEQELRASERRYRDAQVELAHVNRVATMGQLTASIAHEVNQPIAAVVTSAGAGLRWLAAKPPDLEEIRQSFEGIITAGTRAGDVVRRIRALIKKMPERNSPLDINETILETIALTRSEMLGHRILLQTQLGDGLPRVWGDRIQLQQLILNLIMNAIEAMSEVDVGSRELVISTDVDQPDGVLVTVRDSGPGLEPERLDRLFDPFYTTKPAGMGMGLSISRSITEAHGGRLWATANVPRGAVFQFTLHATGGAG